MRSLRPVFLSLILCGVCAAPAWAQTAPPDAAEVAVAKPATVEIQLLVPAGTPLRVALEKRVRIDRVGEPINVTLTHSVYAFDQQVIPSGTTLAGKVARIDPVTKKRRFFGIMNGDFTPARAYELELDSLTLPDGKQIAIDTQVSHGVAEVVRLVSDPEKEKKRNRVAQAASHAKKQASDKVHSTIHTIKSPGKWERFKRYLVAQLPFRRQYIEPGTRFTAELSEPLGFGEITRTSDELAELGSAPAEESWLEARLTTDLSSATAQAGAPVEAIVTAPLYSAEHKLVFPAGSRLMGEVVSAQPARNLHRNGKLRVNFQRIELPDGLTRMVQASLTSMEVDRAAGLKLDTEGGAEATNRKTRYLSTSFAIAAAVLASQREVEPGEAPETNPGAQTAAGGTSFRLIGAVTSFAIGSPVFSTVLGAYGASLSVYRNFLGPGREVNLPVHTPLEITFGKPRQPSKPGNE